MTEFETQADRMGKRAKTVLLVTYAFPPVAYVGVYRSLKYCKYLGRHGWVPIVLTARPHPSAHQDASLCRQIPDNVRVHRTGDIDPAKWTPPWKSRRARTEQTTTSSSAARVDAQPPPPSFLARVKQGVFRLIMASPDSHWLWVPFGFLRGCAVVLRTKVDVIYCSSPPHSSHLIAYALARLWRKPYVMDFRDPWSVDGADNRGLVRRVERFLKGRIVRGAARIICISPGELAEIRAEFRAVDPDRFVCITNGYDASDAPPAQPRRDDGNLTLIHAGTIYPGTAGEFFDALARLVRTDSQLARRIRVDLIGGIGDEYIGTARQLEAAGIVRLRGLVPHQTALQMIRQSDVSVVLLGGRTFPPSEIPAKTFEYLHAGRPILAVAAEGDLADTVRQSGLGIVVPPMRPDCVVDAIRRLAAERFAGTLWPIPNLQFVRRFERGVLAGQLAEILDATIASTGAELQASPKWTSPASQ